MTPRSTSLKILLSLVLIIALSAAIEGGFRLGRSLKAMRPLAPKVPTELRIFAYGESIVQGAPQPAVGFVEQLRHGLRRTYPERYVNVINLGGREDSSDVARAVAATIDQSPDAIIVLTGGNEYLRRTVPSALNRRIRGTSVAVRTITGWLTPPDRAEDPWPSRLVPYPRADLGNRVALLRDNLATILRVAEIHGTPVVLATVPSNLRDWPPVYHRLARHASGGAAAYEATMTEIDQLTTGIRPEGARSKIAQARVAYGDDAMLSYLEGRMEQRGQRYARARELLTVAKDQDPFPWRPLSTFNDVIRASAGGLNVRLVDLERIFGERSEGGSPGFDLMADNIHPNPSGSAVIAEALVGAVRGIVPLGASDRACCTAADFLRETGFYGSRIEVEYLLNSAKYAMKTPFYAFSVSRGHLNKAAALAPSNWEVWANLATLSLLEGDVKQGQDELRKAAELKGSAIDPSDREATPYLHEGLQQYALLSAGRRGQ
jgi:lysophospholipase L1-like esterase